MKYFLLAATILALSGCGDFNRNVASMRGYTVVCVSGVSYLQFPSGATVMVDRDGKPVPCVDS